MRIRRLDLIRYGKFTDCSVHFPPAKRDFHLVVGPNEAGKSTLRSAILDLFFTIPHKSPLDFIHPKSDLRLGALIENPAERLEFQRAKATKQSLRTPSDAPLPEAALAAFLGNADRGFFDQMFGLDHHRLVSGGNSILSAENDVGQVLFQSAAGVASLGKVREALEAEANGLWAPRKSAERAYYIAAEKLERASAALKEATVRTREWSEANQRLQSLGEALAVEGKRHGDLQIERGRLERIRRLAPFLRAMREAERQWQELGEVVELPADAAATLADAQRELAAARQLQQLRGGEAEKLAGELAAIRVDTALLRHAAEIDGLEARRLQYAPYGQEIEQLSREAEVLWQDALEACAQLGWPLPADEEKLAGRLPSLLVRREIGQLARRRSGLVQTLRAAQEAEIAKQAEIESLARLLADLPRAEVKPALRAALSSARSLGDPDTVLHKCQAALARAETLLAASRLGLGRWDGEIAELARMQPPSAEAISSLLQKRQALAADLRAAAKQRDDQAENVARLELGISQYAETHRLITEAEVAAARRSRDHAWRAIKSGETAVAEGAETFEAAMRDADDMADARLDKVEEATEWQSRQHELARGKQSLAGLEARCRELGQELEKFERDWCELAAGLGLAGMALDGISDWLARREKALAAAEAREAARHESQLASATVSESRTRLAEALADIGLAVAPSDTLSALCVQAETFIQGVEAAAIRRQTLASQLQSGQALLAGLQGSAASAAGDLQRWQQAWADALAQAGLPDSSEIGTVEGALELIARIEERLARIRQIRLERIAAMRSELAAFAAEAARLARLLAPDWPAGPGAEMVRELALRLDAARRAQSESLRLRAALERAETQVREAEAAIQGARARLQPLFERARVESTEALADAIARSDRRRSLAAEFAAAQGNLLEGGDGLSRQAIEAEIDNADLARLPAALDGINAEIAGAVERQAGLAAEHATARQRLAAIAGADAAAKAEAQRQEAIAQMAEAAERYVKVHTAARLLRWSIDRYREEKQGPMLARAGAIFSRLTLGSFQRLVVDFEREPMALEGQRADGKLVPIAGMSDGTRDQLYLALRLAALELHLEQAMPLPFIADDLFINYDDTRSRAGLEALAALSERTQVIFLSHHDHLVPTVREVFGVAANVVTL